MRLIEHHMHFILERIKTKSSSLYDFILPFSHEITYILVIPPVLVTARVHLL